MRASILPRAKAALLAGTEARFPAKVPDLIGIKDRKYIDHTATHLHRGVGDIMRYAALVTSAEATEFGPHQMMGKKTASSEESVGH